MMGSIGRCGAMAPYMSATSHAVPSIIRPALSGVVVEGSKAAMDVQPKTLNNYSLSNRIKSDCSNLTTRAVKGFATTTQMRFAHTDLQFPDMSAYRRPSTVDSSSSNRDTHSSRAVFSYLFTGAAGAATIYGAKSVATQFVASMSASADVLAVAKIEVNLKDIPEGKSATFKWRNKPLFIRHRTAEEIATEAGVDITTLRDQQTDDERTQKPEWLIVLGVCTHLGCVPVNGLGDYGGYYCPCHGSHYDASGRIRKGPAPLNLEVPHYTFTEEDVVVVG